MNADRITNFEKMAQADPSNEMAHFSLGNAYLQAGRFAEAAQSLERCLTIAPEMSKAWQLCGQAQVGAGWADKAAVTLAKGYEVAARKGDRMPQQAIAITSAVASPAAAAARADHSAKARRPRSTRSGSAATSVESRGEPKGS